MLLSSFILYKWMNDHIINYGSILKVFLLTERLVKAIGNEIGFVSWWGYLLFAQNCSSIQKDLEFTSVEHVKNGNTYHYKHPCPGFSFLIQNSCHLKWNWGSDIGATFDISPQNSSPCLSGKLWLEWRWNMNSFSSYSNTSNIYF